jgi:hypothetical protein
MPLSARSILDIHIQAGQVAGAGAQFLRLGTLDGILGQAQVDVLLQGFADAVFQGHGGLLGQDEQD